VRLAFPEIAPEAMAKLAHAAALKKDNPDLADEPRVPGGNPDGGEWTNDGDEGGRGEDANVRPAAAQTGDVQAKKEGFVDAHLADAQKAADQLGVPVENILALSALESRWGTSRFETEGNNYFGIHYPARPTPPATCRP
jgi:membrane-bound lytic murein transglycosylase B